MRFSWSSPGRTCGGSRSTSRSLPSITCWGDEASMAELSWMFDSGDPAHMLPNNLYGPACSPKGFNGGCYQNSNVDLLMNAALKINEREQRGAVYRQIQQIVADDAPWIFVDIFF